MNGIVLQLAQSFAITSGLIFPSILCMPFGNQTIGGIHRKRTEGTGRRKKYSYDFIEYRDKKLLTVLGLVTVKRAYYYDRECRNGYCPKDRALDIEGISYRSGERRMMSKVGAYRPFGLGHEDFDLADIRVGA